MIDRWTLPGAPRRLLETIRGAFTAFVERLPGYGLSIDSYLLEARDAFDLPEVRALYDDLRSSAGGAPLESSTRSRKPAALPTWSTLVSSWKLLLQKWGREGWCVIWPKISEIAKTLGLKRRQAWERMYWLEELGLIRVWRRWESPMHDVEDDEPRSNIIGLFLPEALLEALRERIARREARRAARSRAREVEPGPASIAPSFPASPASTSAPASTRSPASTRAPTSTSAPVGWLTWAFLSARGEDARYRGEDARQAGSMKEEHQRALLDLFAAEASSLREVLVRWRAEHPSAAPDAPAPPREDELPRLAQELAGRAIRDWLRGGDSYEIRARHAFGLFARPAPALARAARDALISDWIERATECEERALEASQPKPRKLPRAPLAVARQISAAHVPAEPSAAPRRLGLSPDRLQAFAELAAEEEREATSAPVDEACPVVLPLPQLQVEPDLDTLVSAAYPPPE